ncbi:atrial natriuretic peptide receptor 3-like [Tubulanus polymorphus]|uniref:atrial natriuretic peptide receptor 3-like n=1 Tax=Tubulanus polymorphus TaxID=672921 RepID=UPI003DA29278
MFNARCRLLLLNNDSAILNFVSTVILVTVAMSRVDQTSSFTVNKPPLGGAFKGGGDSDVTYDPNKVIKIGINLPTATKYMWSTYKVAPAIEIAVDTVERTSGLLDGYTFQLNYADSRCSETYGPMNAINFYIQQEAHVFIGPSCDYAVAPVARFSVFWGIPIISSGALVHAFADKTEFPLLTRIVGNYDTFAHMEYLTLREFDWNRLAFVYEEYPDQKHTACFFALEALYKIVKKMVAREHIHKFNLEFPLPLKRRRFKQIVSQLKHQARSNNQCGLHVYVVPRNPSQRM